MKEQDNTANTPERRALSVNEFCAAYGLSRSTAYKLMKQGTLRTVKIGGRRVVPVDAAEGLLKGAAR
jgi:excisionase family DNA binding protein